MFGVLNEEASPLSNIYLRDEKLSMSNVKIKRVARVDIHAEDSSQFMLRARINDICVLRQGIVG